ncbi:MULTISPECIES: hypothetical protein [Niastella]|uniref:Uncharacterized protein n=1 Tax=Niastella soli TaxID=2821487 RepID=A0ABS3YTH4_9BACT|nr:hypothetical protein [Niastella soli]MBO9201187.1 hypothetical protein [Niastella soli]
MKKHVLKYRKRWLTGIAIYQLLGGLVMLILLFSILMGQEVSPGVILAIIPMVALSLVSLIAGIMHFIKGNEVRFYTLSKLNFCAQLLQLAIPPGFTYRFYYGPYLAVGVDTDRMFTIKFETLTANFGFSFGTQDEGLLVMLNCIPLFMLIVLRWIERNKIASPEFEGAFIEGSQQEV